MPRLLARNDGKIVVIARSKASAERRSNLAKSLSDGRKGLLRLLARKDGKIIVVARSEASAERRGNLSTLSFPRFFCHSRENGNPVRMDPASSAG